MRKHQRMLARKKKDGDSGFTRKEESSSSASKTTHFVGKNYNWIPTKRSLIAKLNQSKNAQGTPLHYVIRDPGKEEEYRRQYGAIGAQIYDAPLMG